jgi:hypothetical protein
MAKLPLPYLHFQPVQSGPTTRAKRVSLLWQEEQRTLMKIRKVVPTPEMYQILHRLKALGIWFQVITANQFKVRGNISYYPSTGTILIDGQSAEPGKGYDELLHVIDREDARKAAEDDAVATRRTDASASEARRLAQELGYDLVEVQGAWQIGNPRYILVLTGSTQLIGEPRILAEILHWLRDPPPPF